MPESNAVLFGDSHAYAIQRAIERRIAKGRPTPVLAHRLLKEKNDKVIGDTTFESFLSIASSLQPHDAVISVIGGNQHAVFSLVRHPQPYDFIEPDDHEQSLSGDVALIPYRALSSYFSEGVKGRDGKSLEEIRKVTVAKMFHIVPPPPKRDNGFIEVYHEERFAQEGITSLGVSPPELRMKFWRLQTKVLTEICRDLDIHIMLPPKKSLDKDGFLKPEYYANDATHANPEYGELIIQEIESIII
jgi:hypothetical protein